MTHASLPAHPLKVLVVGGGGREHMLAKKLAASPRVAAVFCAPGNAGTAEVATNVALDAGDFAALTQYVRSQGIELTVVGPADPVMGGIVDHFQAAGHAIIGPTRAQAILEGSKAFSKAFMERHGVPTATCAVFTEVGPALAHLDDVWSSDGVVVKMDGLAEVQSTIVTTSREEAETLIRRALDDDAYGEAGARVLIEERLIGPELSILAFIDGNGYVGLPPAQDHKQLMDGGRGINTEGMGAYSPVPLVDAALMEMLHHEVLAPSVRGMALEGLAYAGVLFVGVLLTRQGPKVLEYNCRFGDPEAQATLPGLETDLVDVFDACLSGTLDTLDLRHDGVPRVCLVAADPLYPDAFTAGAAVTGCEQACEVAGVDLIHAMTADSPTGLVTVGGRVLNVLAQGATLSEARDAAYKAIDLIRIGGEPPRCRRDVGLLGERVAPGRL